MTFGPIAREAFTSEGALVLFHDSLAGGSLNLPAGFPLYEDRGEVVWAKLGKIDAGVGILRMEIGRWTCGDAESFGKELPEAGLCPRSPTQLFAPVAEFGKLRRHPMLEALAMLGDVGVAQ